jgi:hypothetical protein
VGARMARIMCVPARLAVGKWWFRLVANSPDSRRTTDLQSGCRQRSTGQGFSNARQTEVSADVVPQHQRATCIIYVLFTITRIVSITGHAYDRLRTCSSSVVLRACESCEQKKKKKRPTVIVVGPYRSQSCRVVIRALHVRF